jgi:hypothetical protein
MLEDSMPVMAERSMPSYIGRRLARAAAPGWWQVAHSRVSVRCRRNKVSWFLPARRSTVTARTGHPAASARFTIVCAISH